MSSQAPPSQKKKVTLYFNSAMLAETQREAVRQDRSISWIIQAAWRIAREEVKRLPSAGAKPVGTVSPGDAVPTSIPDASETHPV